MVCKSTSVRFYLSAWTEREHCKGMMAHNDCRHFVYGHSHLRFFFHHTSSSLQQQLPISLFSSITGGRRILRKLMICDSSLSICFWLPLHDYSVIIPWLLVFWLRALEGISRTFLSSHNNTPMDIPPEECCFCSEFLPLSFVRVAIVNSKSICASRAGQ
jgi:hypothetical protein